MGSLCVKPIAEADLGQKMLLFLSDTGVKWDMMQAIIHFNYKVNRICDVYK